MIEIGLFVLKMLRNFPRKLLQEAFKTDLTSPTNFLPNSHEFNMLKPLYPLGSKEGKKVVPRN